MLFIDSVITLLNFDFMKNNPKLINELFLDAIPLFSNNDLKILQLYNIYTLESLLGATKGLTNVTIFDELEYGQFYLKRLKEQVSKKTLLKYETYNKIYPTGLNIKEDE